MLRARPASTRRRRHFRVEALARARGSVAWLALFLALVMVRAPVATTPLPGDVIADFTDVHQRIDGFGASDRKNPLLTDADADLFFSPTNGIGLSILRASIDPNGGYINGYYSNATKAAARGAIVWAAPWTPP